MRRRDFLSLAGGAAVFPRVAFAQQPAKVPRIAYVMGTNARTSLAQFRGLAQGLAEGDVVVDDEDG